MHSISFIVESDILGSVLHGLDDRSGKFYCRGVFLMNFVIGSSYLRRFVGNRALPV